MQAQVRCPRCGSRKTSWESRELTERRRARAGNERMRAGLLAAFLGLLASGVVAYALLSFTPIQPLVALALAAFLGLAVAIVVFAQAEVIETTGKEFAYRCGDCGHMWSVKRKT